MQAPDTPFWLQPDPENSLPLIHFIHGNSFPTGTYSQFLNRLKSHYQVVALEMHGHNPAYPVTDCWPVLCDELIASIEQNKSKPVILVGHSFGGILSVMVAKMRPDLVRCVIMLDSPIVAGWRARVLHMAKKLGVDALFPPAKLSIKRRKIWPNQEAAFQHFAQKELFSIWPEEVLRDYIRFGTEPYAKGVTLRFKRDIETAIYRTLPHTTNQYCAKPYPVPVGFIGGTASEECRQAGLHHIKQFVGKNFTHIEGGHLYPLEKPIQTADYVHAMIKKLLPD